MKTEIKEALGVLGSCAFALWGAWLNASITVWLSSWHGDHYNMQRASLLPPMVQILLGLLLGFVTCSAFLSKKAESALLYGFYVLFAVTTLSFFNWFYGASLLLCFDNYFFSFLWALSLIAISYILRSRPKNHIN